jgi:hypothetical protein
MEADIVELLEDHLRELEGLGPLQLRSDLKRAIAEIKRMRAEIEGAEDFIPRKFAGLREQNKRLREALNEIRGCKAGEWDR